MNKDLLLQVKRIIVHGNCPDGMASAMFLFNALGIEPEFLTHNQDEYLSLEATPGMLFCDIAPPVSRYQEFVDAGAIVLDHHKKAEHIVKAFGERGVFADEKDEPGVSGAVLAYREVWRPLCTDTTAGKRKRAKQFATLIGISDTWQKISPDWTKARHMTAAVMFYPWDYWEKKSGTPHFEWSFEHEQGVGQMIFEDRLRKSNKCAKEAYKFEHEGHKVAVFNDLAKLSSDVGEILRNEGFNVIAGFRYSGQEGRPTIGFSLRSDGTIDVSDFACHFDEEGGGHTMAAGFSLEMRPEDPNAFMLFKDLFEDYIFTKGEFL